MIKIRYAELPAGLHVRTEARGRTTIVYLLPGLTPAERRAALLRARRGAGLGYGPPLPAASVVFAVMRDRVRHTLGNGLAAFRAHPLLLVPPLVVVASAGLVYVMMSAVTFTIRSPQAGGPDPQPGATAHAGRTGRPAQQGGGSAGLAGPTSPAGSPGGPGGHGGHGHRPRPSSPPDSSPAPLPSGTGPDSPSPLPTSGPPGGSPSTLPTGSPSPSPSPTNSCLDIGTLGICLKF